MSMNPVNVSVKCPSLANKALMRPCGPTHVTCQRAIVRRRRSKSHVRAQLVHALLALLTPVRCGGAKSGRARTRVNTDRLLRPKGDCCSSVKAYLLHIRPGSSATLSPTERSRTFEPTATTTPLDSCPRTIGLSGVGKKTSIVIFFGYANALASNDKGGGAHPRKMKSPMPPVGYVHGRSVDDIASVLKLEQAVRVA